MKMSEDDIRWLAEQGFTAQEIEATLLYLARRDGRALPEGKLDRIGRRFELAPGERRWCCYPIRPPSYAWPHSLLMHAKTARHCAVLKDVDLDRLRKAARLIDKRSK